MSDFTSPAYGDPNSDEWARYVVDHAFEKPVDYLVRKKGSNIEVIYGRGSNQAGKIVSAYTSTDLCTTLNDLLQSADSYATRKTLDPISIDVEYRDYTVTEKLLINRKGVYLNLNRAKIRSALLPWLEIDGSEFVWDSTEPNLNNLEINNLQAEFTGTAAANPFVYVHDVHVGSQYPASGDDRFGGEATFKNWNLIGKFSTTANFSGLKLGANEGCKFQHLNIRLFNTGIHHVNIAPWQGSHNFYESVHVREQYGYGVYYNNAPNTCETWVNPKIMTVGSISFYLDNDAVANLLLMHPQIEGYWGTGIESKASHTTILNPLISTCGGAGNGGEEQTAIRFSDANSKNVIINTKIITVVNGIKTAAPNTMRFGARYTAVTNSEVTEGAGTFVGWA